VGALTEIDTNGDDTLPSIDELSFSEIKRRLTEQGLICRLNAEIPRSNTPEIGCEDGELVFRDLFKEKRGDNAITALQQALDYEMVSVVWIAGFESEHFDDDTDRGEGVATDGGEPQQTGHPRCEMPDCSGSTDDELKTVNDPENTTLQMCTSCLDDDGWHAVVDVIEPENRVEVGQQADPEGIFDAAKANVRLTNEKLAATDGAIAEMQFGGAIGYHHYLAAGETDIEYLWRVALLQAFDNVIYRMMHVEAEEPEPAAEAVTQQLEEHLDSRTADRIGDRFEEELIDLIDVQEDRQ